MNQMTSCYFRLDQLERLKLLSAKTGVPMAEYVRQGVEKILEKHEERRPDISGTSAGEGSEPQ